MQEMTLWYYVHNCEGSCDLHSATHFNCMFIFNKTSEKVKVSLFAVFLVAIKETF